MGERLPVVRHCLSDGTGWSCTGDAVHLVASLDEEQRRCRRHSVAVRNGDILLDVNGHHSPRVGKVVCQMFEVGSEGAAGLTLGSPEVDDDSSILSQEHFVQRLAVHLVHTHDATQFLLGGTPYRWRIPTPRTSRDSW